MAFSKRGVSLATVALFVVSAAAQAATVNIGTGSANVSQWSASFQATPGFGAAAPASPGTPAVVQYYNSAWTGGAGVAAAAPSYGVSLASSDWISTKFPTLNSGYAYNGTVTYGIDLGLDATAGSLITYGFAFSSDNFVTSVKLVDGASHVDLYDFDLPNIAPGSGSFYRQFTSQTIIPSSFISSPGSNLRLEVSVFNEGNLDSTEMSGGYYASPTGLIFAGSFSASPPMNLAASVPLPMSSVAGLGLLGAMALGRWRRNAR